MTWEYRGQVYNDSDLEEGLTWELVEAIHCGTLIDDVVNLNEILAKQAKLLGNENHISTPHLAITTSNLNINQVSVGDRIISKT